MKKDIKYITIDGRGKHGNFIDYVIKVLESLKHGANLLYYYILFSHNSSTISDYNKYIEVN